MTCIQVPSCKPPVSLRAAKSSRHSSDTTHDLPQSCDEQTGAQEADCNAQLQQLQEGATLQHDITPHTAMPSAGAAAVQNQPHLHLKAQDDAGSRQPQLDLHNPVMQQEQRQHLQADSAYISPQPATTKQHLTDMPSQAVPQPAEASQRSLTGKSPHGCTQQPQQQLQQQPDPHQQSLPSSSLHQPQQQLLPSEQLQQQPSEQLLPPSRLSCDPQPPQHSKQLHQQPSVQQPLASSSSGGPQHQGQLQQSGQLHTRGEGHQPLPRAQSSQRELLCLRLRPCDSNTRRLLQSCGLKALLEMPNNKYGFVLLELYNNCCSKVLHVRPEHETVHVC